MRTIILPGYSPHNRDWAYEVKKNLEPDIDVFVHEWKHWTSGSFSMRHEAESILSEIAKENVNIIAKSVGTRVCMELTSKVVDQIDKVILCGIPLRGFHEEAKEYFRSGLLKLDENNVICFQNKNDPFGKHSLVEGFMKSVNDRISVIEKPASDHNYPYFEDFKSFLIS